MGSFIGMPTHLVPMLPFVRERAHDERTRGGQHRPPKLADLGIHASEVGAGRAEAGAGMFEPALMPGLLRGGAERAFRAGIG